jgi:hypothetical protein
MYRTSQLLSPFPFEQQARFTTLRPFHSTFSCKLWLIGGGGSVSPLYHPESRGSAVNTGYGLDDQGVGVRVPVESSIFTP